MATVYLAEDFKHSRKVALKILKPELTAVLGAERFVPSCHYIMTRTQAQLAEAQAPARRPCPRA